MDSVLAPSGASDPPARPADYRGVVFVLLYNHGDKEFEGEKPLLLLPHYFTDLNAVDEGDRIAQLILERIYTPEVVEVEVRHLNCNSSLPPLT